MSNKTKLLVVEGRPRRRGGILDYRAACDQLDMALGTLHENIGRCFPSSPRRVDQAPRCWYLKILSATISVADHRWQPLLLEEYRRIISSQWGRRVLPPATSKVVADLPTGALVRVEAIVAIEQDPEGVG